MGSVTLDASRCLVPGEDLRARWSGFVDSESGIASYSYALFEEGSSPGPWRALGRQYTTVVNTTDLAFSPTSYVLRVRACNGASLCAEADSVPFFMSGAGPPSGGVVLVQSSHGPEPEEPAATRYISNATGLAGSWADFVDAAGAGLSYEVCVGTSQYGCQTMPNTLAVGTDWSNSTLQLQCGQSYHMAVQASNCAGLHTTVASASTKLCCSEGAKVSLVRYEHTPPSSPSLESGRVPPSST